MNPYTAACERLHDELLAQHCSAHLSGTPEPMPTPISHVDRLWAGTACEYKTERYRRHDNCMFELLANLDPKAWPHVPRVEPGTDEHRRLLKTADLYELLDAEPKQIGLLRARLPLGHLTSYIRYRKGYTGTLYLLDTSQLRQYVSANVKTLPLSMAAPSKTGEKYTNVGVLMPQETLRVLPAVIQAIDVTQRFEQFIDWWDNVEEPRLRAETNKRMGLELDDERNENEGAVGDASPAGRTDSGQGIGDGQQRGKAEGLRRDGRHRQRDATEVV